MSLKKIRILYTIPNFDTAGSGKVVYDLAKALDKSRFEVIIACNHDKGAFYKTVKALGLPIYLIDATVPIRPYWSLLKRVHPFRDFLKTHQIDLVHSWHWSSDWSEPLACKISNIPFVYTKKAMGWGNIHWKLRSFLSRFIITVNSEMAAFFPYKINQELIPFGLDLSYYSPIQISENQETEVFKIITVANLVPVKNINILIRAISFLAHIPLQFSVLGDDKTSYAEELKRLVAELGLESKVLFIGKQLDIRPFLSAADLYVISSDKEGMPMALVEAMAMGVPVLGSDVSGVNDVLKSFPDLLFPKLNALELAKKIESFYYKTPEEQSRIGNALRNYCETHFSMETFITAHESLYLELTQ
jgi:glycosyltransferase involved in cell wall biosynthesis